MDDYIADEYCAEQDDRAAADLSAERYERTLEALYCAAMLGLQDEDIRHLCAETGVTYADLQAYVPHILRPIKPEEADTQSLPF